MKILHEAFCWHHAHDHTMTMTKSMTMTMIETMIVTTTTSIMTMTTRDKRVDPMMGASNKNHNKEMLNKNMQEFTANWKQAGQPVANYGKRIYQFQESRRIQAQRTRTHTHMRTHRLEQQRAYNAACACGTGQPAPPLLLLYF